MNVYIKLMFYREEFGDKFNLISIESRRQEIIFAREKNIPNEIFY